VSRIRAWRRRRRYAAAVMSDIMDAGYPVPPGLVKRLIKLGQECGATAGSCRCGLLADHGKELHRCGCGSRWSEL